MERMGASKVKEVIKNPPGETIPLGGNGFYAVANGKKPGIYPFYQQVLPEVSRSRCSWQLMRFSGENDAEKEAAEEKDSCHEHLRTMAQAEAFIED